VPPRKREPKKFQTPGLTPRPARAPRKQVAPQHPYVPGRPDRAENVIRFIETLRQPDGPQAGQLIRLQEWQKADIRAVYTRDENDERIVTLAIQSIARKNGKTVLVAGIMLAHLCGPEAIRFGQLYSLGVDRTQAGVLYKYARNMVLMDEELSERIEPVESRFELTDKISGSVYRALAADGKAHHGKSSSFLVFDELAQLGSNSELYSVMRTSTGAHGKNALTWVISTQAPDDEALLSQLIDRALKAKRGEINDPSVYVSLYAVPPDGDIFDIETMRLANPALGTHRSEKELLDYMEQVRGLPSLEAAYRNLYANQRVSQTNPWIDYDLWMAAQGAIDMEEMRKYDCWVALDLSERIDLTAAAAVWRAPDGRRFARVWFWTPRGNLGERERQDEASYGIWIDQGHGFAPPGRIVAVDAVAEWLREFAGQHKIRGIAYDRWKFERFLAELDDLGVKYHTWPGHGQAIEGVAEGFCLMKHGQGFSDGADKPDMLWMPGSLSALEQAIATKNITIHENPALNKATAFAVVRPDGTGNRKFEKPNRKGAKTRIDPLIALTMAVGASENAPVSRKKSFWAT
jgi:phage terminase large subunit-like protein